MGSNREPMVVSNKGVDVPDVPEMLVEANAIPTPKIYRPLHEYGGVIHLMLEEKKMSYREIRGWFCDRGIDHSEPHFSNAYQKWRSLNAAILDGALENVKQ